MPHMHYSSSYSRSSSSSSHTSGKNHHRKTISRRAQRRAAELDDDTLTHLIAYHRPRHDDDNNNGHSAADEDGYRHAMFSQLQRQQRLSRGQRKYPRWSPPPSATRMAAMMNEQHRRYQCHSFIHSRHRQRHRQRQHECDEEEQSMVAAITSGATLQQSRHQQQQQQQRNHANENTNKRVVSYERTTTRAARSQQHGCTASNNDTCTRAAIEVKHLIDDEVHQMNELLIDYGRMIASWNDITRNAPPSSSPLSTSGYGNDGNGDDNDWSMRKSRGAQRYYHRMADAVTKTSRMGRDGNIAWARHRATHWAHGITQIIEGSCWRGSSLPPLPPPSSSSSPLTQLLSSAPSLASLASSRPQMDTSSVTFLTDVLYYLVRMHQRLLRPLWIVRPTVRCIYPRTRPHKQRPKRHEHRAYPHRQRRVIMRSHLAHGEAQGSEVIMSRIAHHSPRIHGGHYRLRGDRYRVTPLVSLSS